MRKNGSIITTTVPLVKIVIIIDNICLGDAIKKNCDYSRIAQVYRQYCLGVDGDHDDDDDDDDG